MNNSLFNAGEQSRSKINKVAHNFGTVAEDFYFRESLVSLLKWYTAVAKFTQSDQFRIPSSQKDEVILHGSYTDMQNSVPYPTKYF